MEVSTCEGMLLGAHVHVMFMFMSFMFMFMFMSMWLCSCHIHVHIMFMFMSRPCPRSRVGVVSHGGDGGKEGGECAVAMCYCNMPPQSSGGIDDTE